MCILYVLYVLSVLYVLDMCTVCTVYNVCTVCNVCTVYPVCIVCTVCTVCKVCTVYAVCTVCAVPLVNIHSLSLAIYQSVRISLNILHVNVLHHILTFSHTANVVSSNYNLLSATLHPSRIGHL